MPARFVSPEVDGVLGAAMANVDMVSVFGLSNGGAAGGACVEFCQSRRQSQSEAQREQQVLSVQSILDMAIKQEGYESQLSGRRGIESLKKDITLLEQVLRQI